MEHKSMAHKGWHSRGFLPHFDSQEAVQFVTFRLSDSLPKDAMERIRAAARPESMREELLDRGWGACWLKTDDIAQCVEQSFLFFDGVRYRLHAWTIMPNHVHVLPFARMGTRRDRQLLEAILCRRSEPAAGP